MEGREERPKNCLHWNISWISRETPEKSGSSIKNPTVTGFRSSSLRFHIPATDKETYFHLVWWLCKQTLLLALISIEKEAIFTLWLLIQLCIMRDTTAKYEVSGGTHISQGRSARERSDGAIRSPRKSKGMLQFAGYASLVLPTGSF